MSRRKMRPSRGNPNYSAAYLNSFREPSRSAVMLTVPPGSQSGFAPDRLRTHLRFHKLLVVQNSSANSASVRFEPTYAYDVDPTVASTAMPGFTEYSGLFRKYRVNGFKAVVSYSNVETTPVLVYIAPLNQDPGSNVVGTTAQTILAQPCSQERLVGPITGNGTTVLTCYGSVAGLGGSSNQSIDDNYSAFTSGSSSPANNMYLHVGAIGQGATLTSGVQVDITIDIDIEFFEAAFPAS